MSRLEKYHNIEKEKVLDNAYNVNPIKNDVVNIKREKQYQAIKLKKLDINTKVVDVNNNEAKELFDIEEAFKALEKEHLRIDRDTQLEIMNELFTIENVERKQKQKKKLINAAKEFKDKLIIKNKDNIYKDEHTNKIYISEDELINILEQKEEEHNKKIKRKNSWQDSTKLSNTMLFDKDDLIDNDVTNIKNDDLVKNRLFKNKKLSKNDDSKLDKLTIVLIAIIIILFLILAYLVYSFFN